MAEYAEYQQNNMEDMLHFNYGVELFPNIYQNPIIKKNTQEEAMSKLKKLLRNNGFAFLTGKILYLLSLIINQYKSMLLSTHSYLIYHIVVNILIN